MLTGPSKQAVLCALQEKQHRAESRGREGWWGRASPVRPAGNREKAEGRAEQAQRWLPYKVVSGFGEMEELPVPVE